MGEKPSGGGKTADRGREEGHNVLPHNQDFSDLFPVLMQAQGSLLNFRKMIHLKTGKIAELSYASYGCYCGLGGKGSPKDATDW
jgi:hypothetical protein